MLDGKKRKRINRIAIRLRHTNDNRFEFTLSEVLNQLKLIISIHLLGGKTII